MNQEGEPVKVDILDPVSRKTHHMLLFFSLLAVRASPDRHAENPVSFLSAAGHGPLPDSWSRRFPDSAHQHDVAAPMAQGPDDVPRSGQAVSQYVLQYGTKKAVRAISDVRRGAEWPAA
jgi:hypothetical protein